ncbi:coagulation factor XIII A chain-like [Acanthochromis polyacanthus]|uniref:coagulation factor XIII A chain-like n=1 Tax=Acanthochromis polyacanthus TaxID=80966 RepID=UPI002234E5A5|nr:coagulation factor XIII A chain-like [Acanthochromis polyacanthus]
MVPPTNPSYKGRYSEPVPVSNLKDFGDDFAEFEPFDGIDEATPRSYPGGATLTVENVDMSQQINKPKHYTTAYETQNLVVRRGHEFVVRVSFNRELVQEDDFQLEFLIGSNPSANKGSLVVVTFGSRRGGPWAGQILEMQGSSVLLGVTPSPTAIVGKYRTYVAISVGSGMQRTKRNAATDLYMLFNAWCPEDPVFLANDSERMEYVLNDFGIIYQGSMGSIISRSWVYGQFEPGILDACIFILDSSRMPIYNRGNIIKVVRKGSAMINSQDDNGVVVGNWSNDYSMGIAPTAWTGSVAILQQYANTGTPVLYGQCWVFAGVFCTFLRCLGIPTRVITNFSSAHDNTGNLKTDLIFKLDGTPDRRATRDSIWNYHCWNECWMTRPDLPAGYGGWQIVDGTPQETSDGHFRCGPASVAAIKEGNICLPFDCGFVFAEVNSDVVFHKKDRYGTMEVFKVDTTHIGQGLFTKALSSNQYVDVTRTYKHPEGSEADSQSMTRAEEYGCDRDHSDVPEGQLSAGITCELTQLGSDIELLVTLTNHGDVNRDVNCHLDVSVSFYTGVDANHFKDLDFTITVAAKQKNSVIVKIQADEYLPHLNGQDSIRFILSGSSEDQSVSAIKVVTLQSPTLTLTVSGQPRVQQQMFVTVSFTNPLKDPLQNVYMYLEGAGVMALRRRYIPKIEPLASVSWMEAYTPRLTGPRRIVAVMYCSNLSNVSGYVDVYIG